MQAVLQSLLVPQTTDKRSFGMAVCLQLHGTMAFTYFKSPRTLQNLIWKKIRPLPAYGCSKVTETIDCPVFLKWQKAAIIWWQTKQLLLLYRKPQWSIVLFPCSTENRIRHFSKNHPQFPPSFELGTFRVWGERDNHYTTETHLPGADRNVQVHAC